MSRVVASIVVLLHCSAALAANVTTSDPDRAWQRYLDAETHIDAQYRFPHSTCFRAAASAYDLPETLLLAVARGESDFEPTARSKANAHGVMQILWPTTARHLGIHRLSELYEPCINIDAGARYLREMLDQFSGNLHLALAAYNYGPERIAADPDNIPSGAEWYSGYIYEHLDYILGDRANTNPATQSLYSTLGHSTLVEFGEPYRAQAFVGRLNENVPSAQLDWFRKGVGRFAVILRYDGEEEFQRIAAQLGRAGFPVY